MVKYIYKSILIITVFLTVFSANGQISISSNHMPSANDTIRYSMARNTNSFDFISTGENKNWDFKSLKASSQDVNHYQNSTSTPYVLNFGFSALGIKVADSLGGGQMGLKNVYTFFKKSTSKWEAVGIGFQLSALPVPQAGKHSNSDEIYTFPLKYKDHDSTDFSLKVPISMIVNLGNYFQTGNRVNTVDGWGKISTPYQSDVECIRIKSVITEYDSLAIAITGQDPINFGFPNNRVEYKWLSTSEKIPMLEVTGTEISGNFTPTRVTFRDNYRSIAAMPLAPVADFAGNKLVAKTNEIITLSDKSKNVPTSYLWTITPAGFAYQNGTNETSKNPQVSFTKTGKYTVKLTATNDIGSNSNTKTNYITIDDNVSVATLNSNQLLSYPNPAKATITIELPSNLDENLKLFIFDMEGKLVKNYSFEFLGNSAIALNTSALSDGRYTLIINHNNSNYFSNFNILK